MPVKKQAQARTVQTTDDSAYDYLGFVTVKDDGCTFRFGIEQTYYSLKTSHENYNALYALLLGAYLNRDKVSVNYSTLRVVDTAPFSVISATTFPG